MGDTKKILKNELPILEFARESVVSKLNIKKNEMLTEKNLTTKRPNTGKIPSKDFFKIIGKKAKRDIPKFKQISYGDIA